MQLVEVGGGEEVVERKVFHSLAILVDRQYPSASSIPKQKKRRPTEIRSVLQPGISGKTNRRMRPLCIPQCIHNHPDLFPPQLRFHPLQHPLEAQPEVDLLRCLAGGNVSRELGQCLDGLDP